MNAIAPKTDFNCPALTIEEVAEVLRLGENTAYELIKAQKMPGAYRFVHSWRIYGPTVLACMTTGRSRPATAGGKMTIGADVENTWVHCNREVRS